MKTITRLSLWITAAFIIATVESQTTGIAQVGETSPATRVVVLSVNATFYHSNKQPRYFSYWSGKLFCQRLQSNESNEPLKICFPLGLGDNPSLLSMRWTTVSKNNKTRSSGPVFISLVKSGVDPSDVLTWTQMKEFQDPSLIISLVPLPEKENVYTNEEEIKGKIVGWLTEKKETACLLLARVRIPEHSILLNYLPAQQGEPSMQLTIRSMLITDVEEETWTKIIERGNRHLDLPSDPEEAECSSFIARTDSVYEEGMESITEFQRIFLQTYRAGDVGPSDMKKIIGYLDASVAARKIANRAEAIKNIMRCCGSFSDLVKKGKGLPQDAHTVFGIRQKVLAGTFPASRSTGRRIPVPPRSPSGPEVTYFVQQTMRGYTPDGTIGRPYWSISQAYDAAKAVDSRSVKLIVAGGCYDESLTIDRNTILEAMSGTRPIITSTITCTHRVELDISGFSLYEAPSPGALLVLVPGSSISLTDVEINGATRYGIFQRGGEIELRYVHIYETHRETGQLEYGAGLVLQDGVHAILSAVTLTSNESSGIILRGRDSHLYGNDIFLSSNKLHPDFYREASFNNGFPSGAFLITDQAEADLTDLRMQENEFAGLCVYRNAVSTVNNAIITHSRPIRVTDDEGVEQTRGGMGIRARYGGRITMENFTISDCDLLGVGVDSLGEIDLRVGEVNRNLIGAYVGWAFDFSRLEDRVTYSDNGRTLDSEDLPVPSTTPDAHY